MPFTVTVTSRMSATRERNRQMVQPAWDETVEKVSACRARARERIVHAIALPGKQRAVDIDRAGLVKHALGSKQARNR
ncbi:hypothetical protein JCM14469_02460 [Desulfatiferula olefinivorans]